jgi:ribonucleoside-triphosphate reductase
MKCQEQVEVYSRVCGFFRPVQIWNRGKKEEFKDRTAYAAPIEFDAAEERKL